MAAPPPLTPHQESVDARGADFSDAESKRVLADAALVIARELGRDAAREYFAELIGNRKAPQ